MLVGAPQHEEVVGVRHTVRTTPVIDGAGVGVLAAVRVDVVVDRTAARTRRLNRTEGATLT